MIDEISSLIDAIGATSMISKRVSLKDRYPLRTRGKPNGY